MYNESAKTVSQHDSNFIFDWSNSTILVIEDDIVNYKVTESILRTTGIKILHAQNGYKAIDYVLVNPQINLVLIDEAIFDISCVETTRELLDVNPLLPIIAQASTYKKSYMEAGCIDYINKPTDEKVLFKIMSKFLSNKFDYRT